MFSQRRNREQAAIEIRSGQVEKPIIANTVVDQTEQLMIQKSADEELFIVFRAALDDPKTLKHIGNRGFLTVIQTVNAALRIPIGVALVIRKVALMKHDVLFILLTGKLFAKLLRLIDKADPG